MAGCAVKTYPELNLAVLRRREEAQFRLWLFARALDTEGAGWVDLVTLRGGWSDELGLHPQTLWRALKAGNGTWWAQTETHLRLFGLERVCQRLDVNPTRNPVLVPMESLRSMGDFRAYLFAATLTKPRDDDQPISLATLCGLTGYTRRTIHAWCKRAGVHVEPTYMVSERPVPDHPDPELARQGYRVDTVNGKRRLVRRMPNVYHTHLETLPRGMVRHLHATCLSSRRATRLYVNGAKAGARAIERLAEGETVYTPAGRTENGARVWQRWTRVNGEVRVW